METLVVYNRPGVTWFKLQPGDGTAYKFGIAEIDNEVGKEIFGCDDRYALFISDQGKAYPFPRGKELNLGYFSVKTGIENYWTVNLFAECVWPRLSVGDIDVEFEAEEIRRFVKEAKE